MSKEEIRHSSLQQKVLLLKAEKSRLERDIDSINIDLKSALNDK